MLPTQHRIRKQIDFSRVYSVCRRFKTDLCVVLVHDKKNSDLPTRVGVVVSKKVGKANIRNRLKRQIREVFRKIILDLKSGFDIVVVVYPNAVGHSYTEIETQLGLALNKLGISMNFMRNEI